MEPRALPNPTPSLTGRRGWEPRAIARQWALLQGPSQLLPSLLFVNHPPCKHCKHCTLDTSALFTVPSPLHLHIGPLSASFAAKWNVFQNQGLTSEGAIIGPIKIEAMIIITKCRASPHLRVHHPACPVYLVSLLPRRASQTPLSTHLFPHAQDRQFAHGAHPTSDHPPCQVLDMSAPI